MPGLEAARFAIVLQIALRAFDPQNPGVQFEEPLQLVAMIGAEMEVIKRRRVEEERLKYFIVRIVDECEYC